MAQYRTCEICGANLDPGEICDCTKKADAPAASGTPAGHEAMNTDNSIAVIQRLVNDGGKQN